jgi:glycerol-3-phosphate acyltransferase PlsY
MPHEHLTDATKHLIDGASIATAIGTMMQVLPAIAALFTIIWTTIRIYETKTVQKLLGKNKD